MRKHNPHRRGAPCSQYAAAIPRSSFLIPHFHVAFQLSLVAVLSLCGTSAAQDSGRFFRWMYQDAKHVLVHDMPTVGLLGLGSGVILAAGTQSDEEIAEQVQTTFDGHEFYLKAANSLGTPPAVLGPLVLFGVSSAVGYRRLQDATFTSLEAILYAGAITVAVKEVVGRYRPFKHEGPHKFAPFSGNKSFPSGHATIAFAMLTPMVYYYRHPVTYGLFAVGAATDLARIALYRHWASDVIVGSGIGFLMGRYLSKRHLSQARSNSPVSVTPMLSPTTAGVHITIALGNTRHQIPDSKLGSR